METLHGLVNKGVKVELGIPYDLWDEPSVEVTLMKKQVSMYLLTILACLVGFLLFLSKVS